MKKIFIAIIFPGVFVFSAYSIETNAIITEIKVSGTPAKELNPLFFGFNYWCWVKKWGNYVAGTEPLVKALDIKLLRAGGINNDAEIPEELSDRFLTQFGDYCRAVGAQPLLQVPVISRGTIPERISRATNLIRDFIAKGFILRYVSIGNEPDGYPTLKQANDVDVTAANLNNFTVYNYIDNFTNISAAIKKEFPGIKIIGLELGWKYDEWIPPFISACRPYIDILSIHRYGYWPMTNATYENAIGEYDNLTEFYKDIRTMTDPSAPGIPLIIGEMNSSADGDPSKPATFAMPGSFGAGLWIADNLGISSSESDLMSVMPWSISEFWREGFIMPVSLKPTPMYYAYMLFSNHVKKYNIFASKINNDTRVYAYRDGQGNVSVFCINWSKNSFQDIKIDFNGLFGETTLEYKFAPLSITCLEISKDMAVKKAYAYTSEMADADKPASEEDF